MRRRRSRQYEQERPLEPQLARVDAEGRREDEPVAREVLRLQESGGNEAVATMLARRVTKTVDKDNPEDDKPGADKPATATIVFSNDIGVIPLLSFTKADGELRVTVPSSDQDVALSRAAARGERIDKVVVSRPGFELTLTDVYITSADASGHDEKVISLSLNYAKEEWGKKEPQGKPD